MAARWAEPTRAFGSRPSGYRVLHLNAELLDADSGPSWVSFRYRSKPRPIALLDRRPAAIEIDSEPAPLEIEQTKTHWALRLPRGEHCVVLRF